MGLPADPTYTTAGRRKYVRASLSTAEGMVAVNMTVCNQNLEDTVESLIMVMV